MESQFILSDSKSISLISKSKEEIAKLIEKYSEPKAKQFYRQILNEIVKAISLGDIIKFKKISDVIDCISNLKTPEILQDYFKNSDNYLKNTNLIILACKHNKLEILQHIFDEKNNILEHLSFDYVNNLPKRKDDETHNAFYYAIRSCNLELLETLISKWPNDYFATNSEELDEILSKAYKELKLKNVCLTEEVIVFVEKKLIDLRFFSNGIKNIVNVLNNIQKRISLVVDNIRLLLSTYLSKKIDSRFLHIAKFIAQNIHILKQQLKYSYIRLPWEEMEFCLIAFISCQTKQQEMNLFYQATLNKHKLLNHLDFFAKNLDNEKQYLDTNVGKFSQLPKMLREKVIAKIMLKCPEFKELYSDYQKIIDVYSLEKISNYIKLALLADPKDKSGQLIIIRVLQVMGEYLKNTLESPKLSNSTSKLLLLSLPQNTRQIIIDLRNSLSHAYSLSRRSEIEKTATVDFFVGVQNDSKKIADIITDILCQKKMKTLQMLLEKIINIEDEVELKEITTIINNFQVEKMLKTKFVMTEIEKLEVLIKELNKCFNEKTKNELELFQHIDNLVKLEKAKSENNEFNLKQALAGIKALYVFFQDKINVKGLKFRAGFILKNMTTKIEPSSIKEIVEQLKPLYLKSKVEDRVEVRKILWEICFVVEEALGNIKWIDELREKLGESSTPYTPSNKSNINKLSKEKYNQQLAFKLSELKSILSNKQTSSFKNNNKLQAVIEMLVLDILSIIGSSKKNLENNHLFLDDNTPLLTGKSLRNHLAHYNAIVDISLFDPSLLIFLNAEKLTKTEDIIDGTKKLGKCVIDDPFTLKVKFDEELTTITNQELLFAALEEGDYEKVKNCLQKGADIFAKNICYSTTLELATMGSNIEIIKFILEQNVKGEKLLHIAAANGDKILLEFLIKELKLDINEVDNRRKTPLHVAALNGHLEAVKILLKHKAYIDCQDEVFLTPLFYATRKNHIDVVNFLFDKSNITDFVGGYTLLHETAENGYLQLAKILLLDKKLNVNAKNERNWTPLHAASYNGYLEIVNFFIKNGADVNAKVVNGCTALYYAVENGNENIVNLLVKHGASVNVFERSSNTTPLHIACVEGKEKIVKILLKNKARPNVTNEKEFTPLHLAAQEGHLGIVQHLLEHSANINTRNENHCSPLDLAVVHGHQEIVELLIKNKADINAKNNKGSTPLHYASFGGHSRIVDILLKNKCNINVKDNNCSTPLHEAARNDFKYIIETLIKNKHEIDAKNKFKMTPLHIATLFGNVKSVEVLVKYGANVNSIDEKHMTPLHWAVQRGHKQIINILLKNKSNVNAKNIEQHTPLDIAFETNHKDVIKILFENGAKINDTSLLSAVKNNNKDMVKIVLANGADVNAQNGASLSFSILAGQREIVDILLESKNINLELNKDCTFLHVAALAGDKKIVSALVAKGAKVNAYSKSTKNTPLHVAAEKAHHEIAKILIENGADVNGKPSDITPLQIAAVKGHTNVAKVLLDNGADCALKDYENRTAFELAVSYGRLEIVKMIFKNNKINLNSKGNGDFTVLHIASQVESLEMVKYLVNNGADINAKNDSGSKPIHIAAREGFIDTVEFFLDKGLNINEFGNINQTLLHHAAMNGQLGVVKLLLSRKADINARDKMWVTPLHLAAYFGHKDVIKILLENGAYFNIPNNRGQIPLQFSQNDKVKNLFIATEELFKSVKRRNSAALQNCIKRGAFVNAKNVDNQTPLFYAAWKGFNEITEILLENKADPNITGNKGFTPLHYAVKFSHLNVVKTLLVNGAIFNANSDSGNTPKNLSIDTSITNIFQQINTAFEMIQNKNVQVINYLYKINNVETIKIIMNARNTKKETLIVAAMHNNFPQIEELKQMLQHDISAKLQEVLILSESGLDDKALNLLNEILEKRLTLLGPNNPSTLDIQTHIGKIWYKQGKYQKAIKLFREIHEKQNEILGPVDKDTLITRSTIAAILHRLNENDEAYNIYQDVYQKLSETLGPNHADTLITEFDMALVLCELQKYNEALNINRKIYIRSLEEEGSKGPTVLRAQNNIALVLSRQGNYDEALEIFQEVYEKKKTVFGPNHVDTLRTLNSIAGLLFQQNKYYEALKAHEELYKIQKKILGSKHPETLNTQLNLASTLFGQHKWVDSLKVFNECLTLRKEVFGPNDPVANIIVEKINLINLAFKRRGTNDSDIRRSLQQDINMAVSNGDIETVQRLLEHGFDINEKDPDGRTTLHYAVSNRHLNILHLLLEHGADATQITNKGNTVLHIAVAKGYEDVVKILLKHVKQVNSDEFDNFINAKTSNGGTTALHVAAKNSFHGIVNILLEYGAIFNCVNNDNKTPLEVSTNLGVILLLKLVSELFDDAKTGNSIILNKLRQINKSSFEAVVKARNINGITLLQMLVIYNHKDIAKLLAMHDNLD